MSSNQITGTHGSTGQSGLDGTEERIQNSGSIFDIFPLPFDLPEKVKDLSYSDIIDLLNNLTKMIGNSELTPDTDVGDPIDQIRFILLSIHRDNLTSIFGWSIPSLNIIEKIKQFVSPSDKILEIGAGRGLWGRMLKENGIKIDCTSIVDNHYYNQDHMNDTWTDIELIDAEDAIKKYQPDVLFISWGNGILYLALEHFTGNKVIVIGEYDGATDYIPETDSRFSLVKRSKIIRYGSYLRDNVYFYVRC